MGIAKAVSVLSKDPSTKVGCVIIGEEGEPLTWGYNGQVRGADDLLGDRNERPAKFLHYEHSERNAIYSAARSGIRLKGGTIYITSLTPCPDCARAIVQSGIKKIIVEYEAFNISNPRVLVWLENWELTKVMLREGGVEVLII